MLLLWNGINIIGVFDISMKKIKTKIIKIPEGIFFNIELRLDRTLWAALGVVEKTRELQKMLNYIRDNPNIDSIIELDKAIKRISVVT